MAKEVLAVPEEHLPEVIAVIRAGINAQNPSKEVDEQLTQWCDEQERYLNNHEPIPVP